MVLEVIAIHDQVEALIPLNLIPQLKHQQKPIQLLQLQKIRQILHQKKQSSTVNDEPTTSSTTNTSNTTSATLTQSPSIFTNAPLWFLVGYASSDKVNVINNTTETFKCSDCETVKNEQEVYDACMKKCVK